MKSVESGDLQQVLSNEADPQGLERVAHFQ